MKYTISLLWYQFFIGFFYEDYCKINGISEFDHSRYPIYFSNYFSNLYNALDEVVGVGVTYGLIPLIIITLPNG
jgi:hypothetical protein